MSERSDGGQVLLLTGILLAIAFLIFSVQLSLVANIGQQAGREARNPVLEDYLLMRRTLHIAFEDELVKDDDGDNVCPEDPGDYAGRVQSLLVMLDTHELNRGQAMVGRLADVPDPPGPVEVDLVAGEVTVVIYVSLTDGSTTIQDTIRFIYPCEPAAP